jgi:adenine C2-methylase RlmN of 23S rRNA A2503 and tRNA A37
MIYDTSQQNIQPEDEPADDLDDTRSMTSTATVSTGRVRSTLCVSSQVGCQMGCTFCATGTMGLQGHLTAGEIVEQLAFACQFTPIRNVVFMGMGASLYMSDN